MNIARPLVAWIILIYAAFNVFADLFTQLSWGWSIFLPANYVILGLLISLSAIIHPRIRSEKNRFAVFSFTGLAIVFCAGIFIDLHEAKRVLRDFPDLGPIAYFYSDADGIWIRDVEFINSCKEALGSEEPKIDWRESSWFWIHGGRACTCGAGEPLRFSENDQTIYFKHGRLQTYGFVSLYQPNLIELQRIIGEEIDRIDKIHHK